MLDESQFSILEEKVLAKGNFLKLAYLKYKDNEGNIRECETISRLSIGDTADCVIVVAVLRRTLHYDCLLLVKQFRPALNTLTIEFPIAIISSNETPEKAALRKLKDVAGYNGKVRQVGQLTALDPGVSASTMRVVVVEIDGDSIINQDPTPGNGGVTELLHFPVSEINERLIEYSKEGFIVDSRVQTYALALLLCGMRQERDPPVPITPIK